MVQLLGPYLTMDENPNEPMASHVSERAVALGGELVERLIKAELTGDRTGQCARNLFECLERGEEGAHISLLAGENPDSLQRP